jgi:Uma2 family endonuclease
MAALTTRKISVEEYFELEKRSEVRHEYVDGKLIEMPGGTRDHGIIVKNLVKTLDDVAIKHGCELQQLEVKLRTQNTRYRYPDIMISCNPGSESYFLENPCFIAEVTSESTADVDHGKKLEEYLNLPSLERYAIISQLSRFVVAFRRENGVRTFETFDGTGEFEIPCLGVSLSLDQIYANLEI